MEEIEISSINYVSLRWTKFNSEALWTSENVDMTLATVDCNKIGVHQQLMTTISPLFANILREIEVSQYPVFLITDIQFSEIQAICELLYNGEVLVPADRVSLLMKAGDKLQIKGLANDVELAEDMTPVTELSIESLELDDLIRDSQKSDDSTTKDDNNNSNNVLHNESKDYTRRFTRSIGKTSKRKKNPFRNYPIKTAAVATIESNNVTDEETPTATVTTQLVPIVSTILIDNPIPITCSLCGVQCENEKILLAHKKVHQGKYILHIPKDRSKRTVKNLIKSCPHCPYASEHVSSLSQHLRTHTGEKPFRCKECIKAFPRMTTLREHMRCHSGEKPFCCVQCDKRYTKKHILQNHIATFHSSGEKPFICDYCDKCFAIKKALTKHMETHKLKSIRKRIVSDDEAEGKIEEIIEAIEDENCNETVKTKIFYRRRHKRKKRKLINELTASDFSDNESDPEFKCKEKPDSSQSAGNKTNNDRDIEIKEAANFPTDSSTQIKPTRILPKRNASKPRKSLSPSPPPKRRAFTSPTGNKSRKKKKTGITNFKKSDQINATDYLYYKKSYNFDPINFLNRQNIQIREPECIIQL